MQTDDSYIIIRCVLPQKETDNTLYTTLTNSSASLWFLASNIVTVLQNYQ